MKYLLLTLSLTLTACDLFGGPTPQPLEPTPPTPQRVTLSASQTEGEVPLTVTFSAEASPAAGVFSWVVGGAVQVETSSTLTTTFERSGIYVVSVSAGGASDSVTVTASAPDTPNTGPDIGKLRLTQTPGGPAPWAVRYTVSADAELGALVPGLEARCAENRSYQPVVSGSFACVHNGSDTAMVKFTVAGETVARAKADPDISQNGGVAFKGRWRYMSRGVTETFEIVRGSKTAGESADGRFKLFTVGLRAGLIVEFTIDGRTVVLTPTPGDDGEQRYEGRVYGLVLEPLPGKR